MPLLKESDHSQKREIQYSIAQAIQQNHDHRRHILQERLAQLPSEIEIELLNRAYFLSNLEQISIPELYELLDVFSSLSHHNHTLVDRLSIMGEKSNSLPLSGLVPDEEEIEKTKLSRIKEKLNRINSYTHVIDQDSRPVYEALCTIGALNLLLDPSFPREKIRERLEVLQHLPQWDAAQVHALLAPGNPDFLEEWESQVTRLEEKLQQVLAQPDLYKKVLTYFSNVYPEKFQKVESRLSSPESGDVILKQTSSEK